MKPFVFLICSWVAISLLSLVPLLASEPERPDIDEVHSIKPRERAWNVPKSIDVMVVDENGNPVPGAEVHVRIHGEKTGSPYKDQVESKTDSRGKASLVLGADLDGKHLSYVSLKVKAGGLLLPESRSWDRNTDPSAETIMLPDRLIITLKEGKRVRIRVVDEENRGIPDVTIRRYWAFDDNDSVGRTDANGYWDYGLVEKSFKNRRISAVFRHPDFATFELRSQPDSYPPPVDPEIVTLKRGKQLRGTVVDDKGNPVADAIVFLCGNRMESKNEALTDTQGRYEFRNLLDSQQLMIVKKPGMVRHVSVVTRDKLDGTNDVTLQTAKTLKIRFETNYPEYRDCFGIAPPPFEFDNFEYRPCIHFPVRDKEGQNFDLLGWDEAPDEEVDYTFVVRSFASTNRPDGKRFDSGSFRAENRTYRLRPREDPYVIKVLDVERQKIDPKDMPWSYYDDWKVPEKLTVSVLDETGKPKAGADIHLRVEFDYWHSGSTIAKSFKTDSRGQVVFDLSSLDNQKVMRVFVAASAEKYRTEIMGWYSDPIRGNRKSGLPLPPHLAMLLYPEDKTAGVVRDDDGKPIEGVEVVLMSIWRSVFKGKYYDSDFNEMPVAERSTTTGPDGAWVFDLFPKPEQESGSNEGHFRVSLKKDGYIDKEIAYPFSDDGNKYSRVVTMHRMKTVSGTVVDQDGRPIEGVQISLPNGEKRQEIHGVKTDAEGKFTLHPGTTSNGDKVELMLYKRGLTPIRENLDLAQTTDDLRFTMMPGKDLTVRFVGEGTEEIPEVSVNMTISRQRFGKRGWSDSLESFENAHSGENGKLVLRKAPDREMEYRFRPKNNHFISEKDSYLLMPGKNEHVVKLIDQRKVPISQRRSSGGASYSFGYDGGIIRYQE